MAYDLTGRAAIITGASQGLGVAIARAYVRAGARVAICARDAVTLDAARRDLERVAGDAGQVIAEVADVASETDAKRFVDHAFAAFGGIDILVNNAGVYGPLGGIDEIDWAAWVRAVEINLLGSVLFCRLLLPHFKQRHAGKIIQLSGGGATNPLPRMSAYAASKAAIVRFVETLAEEVKDYGIDVNAIAPGPLNTRLLDEVLTAGPEHVGQSFYERSLKQKESGGAGLERGSELAVFLASKASDGVTGKLISAVWDPWKEFPNHRDDLRNTDIYTLRRIVPKDRGLTWGGE
jgi:NAD(P)-dependent dehydrogenase (short-subunit alcohol dehydrogenase family)